MAPASSSASTGQRFGQFGPGDIEYCVLAALQLQLQHPEKPALSVDLEELKKLACRYALSLQAYTQIKRSVLAQHWLAHEKYIDVSANGKVCLLPPAEEIARGCFDFQQLLQKATCQSFAAKSARRHSSCTSNLKPTLLVDENEHKVEDMITWWCEILDMPCKMLELPVGDYAWQIKEPGSNEARFVPLIVERKTWQDLQDSLTEDNPRMPRQAYAMVKHFGGESCKRILLIEGAAPKETDNRTTKALINFGGNLPSFLQEMQRRHDFYLFFTANELESASFLLQLFKWVLEQSDEWLRGGPLVSAVCKTLSPPTPQRKHEMLHETHGISWTDMMDPHKPLPVSHERQVLVVKHDVRKAHSQRLGVGVKGLKSLFKAFLHDRQHDSKCVPHTAIAALEKHVALLQAHEAFSRQIDVQLNHSIHIWVDDKAGQRPSKRSQVAGSKRPAYMQQQTTLPSAGRNAFSYSGAERVVRPRRVAEHDQSGTPENNQTNRIVIE